MISQVIRLLLFTILFLSVSSILFSSSLFAEGFRILDHGAAATGQGAAFSAQADDPSALHYNPAGMTQLKGIQFSAGTLLIGGSIEFKSASGGKVDGDLGGKSQQGKVVQANLKLLQSEAPGSSYASMLSSGPMPIPCRQSQYP